MIYIRMYLAISLFVSLPAQASKDCTSADTTADMVYCASHDFRVADERLNAVYKELLTALDPEGREKLRNAQRAWLRFRDTNGEFAADVWRNGSQQAVVYYSAVTEMTITRTRELQKEIEHRKDENESP